MLVCIDHPNNVKQGVKESIPDEVINLPYLQEVSLLEINNQNRKIIVLSLYCRPSQNSEEFKSFLTTS